MEHAASSILSSLLKYPGELVIYVDDNDENKTSLIFFYCLQIYIQGRINSHLTGGGGIEFPGGDVHWCTSKELTKLCSSSVTVVSYDLVVSHTK